MGSHVDYFGGQHRDVTEDTDQGPFWMVGVRVNPGGMVAVSSAILAGVGGRNP
jgi:hypothetical protein